jgi:nitronate monooxygenase
MNINLSRRRFVSGAAAVGALSTGLGGTSNAHFAGEGPEQSADTPTRQTAELLRLLGIRYPIIQAPTGGVAGSDLTAAVANSGALGALPLSWSSPAAAQKSILELTEKTDAPFFANFVLTFEPTALEASLDSGVKIVQFSWGMPAREMVSSIRSAGAVLGVQVTSKESAESALALGADYLVCQGVEAGGHVHASMPLVAALEEVLSVAGRVPVVASGGIASGQKMHDYMRLGAAGVVMGSRFVASREAAAHDNYKNALVSSGSTDTVMTTCMNKGWDNATHRILRNSTFKMWESAGCPKPGDRPGESDIISRSKNAPQHGVERYSINSPGVQYTGDIEAMAAYAGTGIDDITDVPGAADIVERIWQEFLRASLST